MNKSKIEFNWAGAVNMSAESNVGPWKAEKRRVLFVDDEKNFVFSLEDILESRGYRLEDEKMHLEAQIRHTQKTEAIAALAGGIALEFIQKPFALDKFSEKLNAVWEIRNYNQGGYDADKKKV